MMPKTRRAPTAEEIPVWFVEVAQVRSYVGWHLRLSQEMAAELRHKLEVLLARQKICGFQIRRVEETVVPAIQFYDRYKLNR